jgi:translation initiation factor 6 (eIF-6)
MNSAQETSARRGPLGLSRRGAGKIMVAVACIGVVCAVLGAIVGWQFLGDLSRANERGLVLADESLDAAELSLAVADDVLAAVDSSLAAIGSTIDTVAASVGDTTTLADSTASLAGQLPVTLDRIDSGLGSIESIAGTIDSTLSQLSRIPLGPDYDPEMTLDESIGGLRADIAPLSASIDAFAADLESFAGGGEQLEADLAALASSVEEVRTAVSGTGAAIEAAQRSAAEAGELSRDTLEGIDDRLRGSRVLLLLVAAVIAVGQIVPYWVGRDLLDTRSDSGI